MLILQLTAGTAAAKATCCAAGCGSSGQTTAPLLWGTECTVPVCRGVGAIQQVRVENVELIALHNLGWGVFRVIMGLVVLVPLITCVYAVEELGLAWSIPAAHIRQTHIEVVLCIRHASFTQRMAQCSISS
jgi:hypothetical protein